MRLLFLTSRLPFPPDRGDRSRVYHFMERLAPEHEIVLISFISHERERAHSDRLSSFCRAIHLVHRPVAQSILSAGLNAWRDIPLQASYYRSRKMRRTIREVAGALPFGAVYVHLFRMAPYAEELRHVYRIVDLTDVISREIQLSLPFRSLLSRGIYAFEQPRIERYERRVAERADEVWLVADRERGALARASPNARLHVVPVGVDANRFYPIEAGHDANRLLFVGNMSVMHNIDAAGYLVEEILPRVQAAVPSAQLKVAGADPGRRTRALGKHPAVSVCGFVPDLNQLLSTSAVFVAPLRFAAGVQNKVIEAMAAGKPVVTTSLVNDGIRAAPGRDLLVADDPDEFATYIVELLRDPSRRRQIGAAARSFVTSHFSWDTASDRIKAIDAERRTNAGDQAKRLTSVKRWTS